MKIHPVVGCTGICIQLLLKRQSSALRAWDLASGLNVISVAVTSSNLMECDETFLQDKLWAAATTMNEGNEPEQVKLMTFHQWKARTLSFFLDKRTVRLVYSSGILFTAPETQWMWLLDQLYIPEGPTDDSSGAKVEVLLWGCIARRWGHIIKRFTSIYFNSGNASDMFSELDNLVPGRDERFGDMAPSAECIRSVIRMHPQGWEVPPILEPFKTSNFWLFKHRPNCLC